MDKHEQPLLSPRPKRSWRSRISGTALLSGVVVLAGFFLFTFHQKTGLPELPLPAFFEHQGIAKAKEPQSRHTYNLTIGARWLNNGEFSVQFSQLEGFPDRKLTTILQTVGDGDQCSCATASHHAQRLWRRKVTLSTFTSPTILGRNCQFTGMIAASRVEGSNDVHSQFTRSGMSHRRLGFWNDGTGGLNQVCDPSFRRVLFNLTDTTKYPILPRGNWTSSFDTTGHWGLNWYADHTGAGVADVSKPEDLSSSNCLRIGTN